MSEIRNIAIASVAAKATVAVTKMLTVTVFMAAWSSEQYGAWILISAIPSWLSMSDLGIGTQSANDITMSCARGDVERASDVLKTSLTSLGLLAVTMTLSVLLLCWQFLPSDLREYVVPITCLTASSSLSFLAIMFEGHYRAMKKTPVSVTIRTVGHWLDLGCLVAVMYMNPTPMAVAIGILCCNILKAFVISSVAMRICPAVSIRLGKFRFGYLNSFMRNGLFFCLLPLGYAVLFEGSGYAVAGTLGLTVVAQLATLRTFTRFGSQLFELTKQSVWPAVSRAIGSGDYSLAREVVQKTVAINFTFACVTVLLISMCGPYAYRVWTSHRFDPTYALMVLYAIVLFPNSIWNSLAVSFESTNRHQFLSIFFFVGACCSVLTVYLFADKVGMIIVPLSTFGFELFLAVFLLYSTRRLFSLDRVTLVECASS